MPTWRPRRRDSALHDVAARERAVAAEAGLHREARRALAGLLAEELEP